MKRIVSLITAGVMLLSLSGCTKGLSNNGVNGNKVIGAIRMDKIDNALIKSNSEFAFDIFKELNKEDSNQNIFISPLSISTALTMTYEGAKGNTKSQMEEALRYKGIDINTLNESYKYLLMYLQTVDSKIELDINNSIWIREGDKIKEDFLKVNKDSFDAYITELDFLKKDSADKINEWIDEATKGKINKMIDPPISKDTVMFLINAIYFKGDWTNKFDKKETFSTTFKSEDGKTNNIMMMSRNGEVEYGAGEDYKVVRLPYGNGKTSMYCILPKEGILINDFIKEMDLNKWEGIKKSISKQRDVLVQIPPFKMEYGIKNLNDSLINLGMTDAFTDFADFSGIKEKTYISRVLHKAVIEVNEEGSTAAGVTVVEVRDMALTEPIKFVGDRPFLFLIADDDTGSILFMGKMLNVNN